MSVKVHAIDHLVINVADIDASAHWYGTVLGVEREDFDPGQNKARRTSIKFGHQKINLRPVDADPAEWFTGVHPRAGSDDLCFLTDAPPETVVEHLRAKGIAVEEGPTQKQGARGPIRSVYCRDPDGNLIEIASYRT